MNINLSIKLSFFLLLTSTLFSLPSDKNNITDETKRKISKVVEYKTIQVDQEKVMIRTEALALPKKNYKSDDTILKGHVSTMSRVIIGDGAKVLVGAKRSAELWYDNIVLMSDAIFINDGEGDRTLSKDTTTDNQIEILQDEASLLTELSISKAYPNPFNPVVNITYGLPTSGDVKILIHDLSGRKIAEHSINAQSAGWHEFNWSAIDQTGQTVGSGIYLLTIQASNMVKKQKIAFLK